MSSNDFLEVINAVKSDLDKQIREKDKDLSELIRSLNITLGLQSIFSKEEKETIESLKDILSDLNTEASLSDIDSLLDDIDLGDVDSLLDELDDIDLDQNDNDKKRGRGRKTNTNWLYDFNISDKDRDNLISWFTGNLLQIFVGPPTFFRREKNIQGANSSIIRPSKIDKNQDYAMVFVRLQNKTGNPISFEAYLEGDGLVFRKITKRTSTKGRKPVYNEKIFETKKAFDLALKKTLIENLK